MVYMAERERILYRSMHCSVVDSLHSGVGEDTVRPLYVIVPTVYICEIALVHDIVETIL